MFQLSSEFIFLAVQPSSKQLQAG